MFSSMVRIYLVCLQPDQMLTVTCLMHAQFILCFVIVLLLYAYGSLHEPFHGTESVHLESYKSRGICMVLESH
jgi:hypothetical protein